TALTETYIIYLHDALPIFLLTAKDSIEDKVTGLDLGANDYITKPFQIEELLARIRVALRNNKVFEEEASEEWLQFQDLKLHEGTDRKSTRLNSSHVKSSYA